MSMVLAQSNELDFHTGLEVGLILGYYMFHPEIVTETISQEQKAKNKRPKA